MYRDIVLKQGQGFNAVFDNVVDSDLRAYRIVYHLDAPITGTLKIDVKRADGEHITDTEPFNGDLAYYVLKTNMYSRQGLSLVRVAITTPEGSIVTQHEIAITVLEPFGDTDISGDDRVPALSSLIIQATQAAGAANAAVDGANEALDRAEALTDPPRAADLIIAPPDALNPQRADIALTAEDDAAVIILDAVGELAQARESDDIAIVIEFLPGNIMLADNTNLDFTAYNNLIIRGNGVRIEGTHNFAVRIIDSYIEKIHATARGGITATNSKIIDCYGRGFALGSLAAINSIIINFVGEKKEGDIGESVLILDNSISFNCTGSSPYNAFGIWATGGGTLTNCTGNSSESYGIRATGGDTLTNCTGNSSASYGIWATTSETKKALIVGCQFGGLGLYYYDSYGVGGIDVEILEQINNGNITLV